MKRTPFYEIIITQKERQFRYYAGPTVIILGPFKIYRDEAKNYCRHLQKFMGNQVKVEFKRIIFKIKKYETN